jgi:hypothetical protein
MDCFCDLVVRVPGYRSRGPGFGSGRYQIFWEVVCLERGLLSLISITEELLEWKSRVKKTEINGCGDLLHWPHDTIYPQKLTLTLPISGSRLVGIVRLWTKATEFSFSFSFSFSYVFMKGTCMFAVLKLLLSDLHFNFKTKIFLWH